MRIGLRHLVSSLCVAILLAGSLAAHAQGTWNFNLPAQPLADALRAVGGQASTNVFFEPDLVVGRKARALSGAFTVEGALTYLLEGTGLRFRYVDERTIAIEPDATRSSAGNQQQENGMPTEEVRGDHRIRLAQVSSTVKDTSQTSGKTGEKLEGRIELEEIVVTGTNIRGSAPVGSPLHTIHREDIDRAGFTTAAELVRSLPQNFAGDANSELPQTATFTTNVTRGSGVNLRGLGSAATLTLLNGRRLVQASGLNGDFVDISSIPLTAVERVEVLTDGASAIYGSDAIAGVVNFILREDYNGAQTRLRVGSDIDGGPEQYQLGQTWGRSSERGSLLFAYEYAFSGALDAMDRPYIAHSDRRTAGGADLRRTFSNPGTIVSPALAGIPSGQDGTDLTAADLLLGQPNLLENAVGRDVFPEIERHNAFLTARRQLSSTVDLFGNLMFARRDFGNRLGGQEQALTVPRTNPNFVTPVPGAASVRVNYNFIDDFGPRRSAGTVTNYASTLGGTYDLPAAWRFELVAAYAREENESRERNVDTARLAEALGTDNPATAFNPAVDGYFNPFGDGSNTAPNVLDYIFAGGSIFESWGEVRSVDTKFDGPLLELPGGSAKLAVGAQYREEFYGKDVYSIAGGVPMLATSNVADERRDISAVFAELVLPLFGRGNSRPGLRRLELSAAVRHEDYSDFGTTTDPKFGAAWSPFEGVGLRATWGTSFKAPDLQNMIPSAQFYLGRDLPSPGGTAPVYILSGANPDLIAETSTTRTFGLDLQPAALRGLRMELTYFDIVFDKRIGTIPNFGLALLNLDLFGPIVNLNPDPALLQSIATSPYFLGDSSSGPIQAVVDGRLRNLAVTEASGFDVTLSCDMSTDFGDLGFTLNGNYLTKFDEAVTVTTPLRETMNTVGQPADLRLRASGSWQWRDYGAFVFVNYTDEYSDIVNAGPHRVDSWTTLDLTLRYDLSQSSVRWMAGTTVSLNIQNLLNEHPPLVNSVSGYDAANATATGRVLALTIGKTW